jgi:retron-type reverse transcriptase
MESLQRVPPWVLRPLPANAIEDDNLANKIDTLAAKLPDSLYQLDHVLFSVRLYCEYDVAVNRAAAHVWPLAGEILRSGSSLARERLLGFVANHLPPQAQARVFRRLVKDSDLRVRRKAARLLKRTRLHEVALPTKRHGDWDATGWLHGATTEPLTRHPQGRRVQEQHGLPVLTNVGQLRDLLGIKSPAQLGWMLLATDAEDGPYTKFTIPKRSGGEREICAPKKQLRWVQRQILDKILAPVSPHDAAHGFIAGRSTVTNALPHKGAGLLLKFDLSDFFPTIHYFRVVGLFTRLGYYVGDGRFHTDDAARQVAPTLARLCCYTDEPARWAGGRLPQGAPTSPAISNLVCRRLDARLTGLAQRNDGRYTRYADDLTFSFQDPKALDLGRFRWWVDQICHQEGFFVNQDKFRVIRPSQRQVVTGIVVNEELRVPRPQRRRLRAILHNCRQHGVASQANGKENFLEYLAGLASYTHMVHPEEGSELLRQVDELLDANQNEGDAGTTP